MDIIMKNLIIALNAAAQEADNIVGKANNSAKGTIYADTPSVINALKPILKRHGLAFHVMPSVAAGQNIASTDRAGTSFNEFSGTQAVHIFVTHSSGEIWDAGEASMPVNTQNKGMTSLDKSMGVLTVLTRKSWLGLLGVVEVDSVEKTLSGISEQEEQDERILSAAIEALNECETYEQMKPIVNNACKQISREAQTALIKIAGEIKAKIGA
jgi:hypothetical protein